MENRKRLEHEQQNTETLWIMDFRKMGWNMENSNRLEHEQNAETLLIMDFRKWSMEHGEQKEIGT